MCTVNGLSSLAGGRSCCDVLQCDLVPLLKSQHCDVSDNTPFLQSPSRPLGVTGLPGALGSFIPGAPVQWLASSCPGVRARLGGGIAAFPATQRWCIFFVKCHCKSPVIFLIRSFFTDLPVTLPRTRAIIAVTVTNSELVSTHNFERFLPCCFCCSVAWPMPLMEQQKNKLLRRGSGTRESHFQDDCTSQVSFWRALPPGSHSCSILSFHQFYHCQDLRGAVWRARNGFAFLLPFSPHYRCWFCFAGIDHWLCTENIGSVVSLLFSKSQSTELNEQS